ncbi:MAG: sugar ABC transporter permease [Gallicola sp.]|uniref:carbohydrate ABC transporter permease n=1 Tax=Gallicola sp. Sow4_E12 TaxID=3438785 RepID=UPI001797E7C3|nr:sugar ABC transporter permease [Gallicola sp.]
MKKKQYGMLFFLPVILIISVFVYLPIGSTFFYSLYNLKLTEPENTEFIGLENYVKVFQDPKFLDSLFNTFYILLWVLAITLIVSFFLAIVLNKKTKLSPLLTAAAIIPWALPPVVNGIVWRFIFYPGYGLLNKLLMIFSVIDRPLDFTRGRFSTLIIVAIIVSWRVIPFCAIIFLSNFQSINPGIYEAAEVDGAGVFDRLWKITLPLSLPAMGVVVTHIIISSMNVFDEIVVLIGYRDMGQSLSIYNYSETFSFLNFGYGSAISYIIMMLTAVVGYFYIKERQV